MTKKGAEVDIEIMISVTFQSRIRNPEFKIPVPVSFSENRYWARTGPGSNLKNFTSQSFTGKILKNSLLGFLFRVHVILLKKCKIYGNEEKVFENNGSAQNCQKFFWKALLHVTL